MRSVDNGIPVVTALGLESTFMHRNLLIITVVGSEMEA